MEHHAQSIDDALIGGLSYKLKAGASYVTNRRSVSYFSSGGNQYSPSGVRVIKFNLTGDQWLDPSTFRVMFQLNNKEYDSAGSIYVKTLSWNPAVLFRRCRLICGGQVIEDIDDFNRLSLMLTALKSNEEQLEIAAEGFGCFDSKYGDAAADNRKTYRLGDFDDAGIVGQSRRVVFKPMAGIFNQDKLIPLRYCPIQIELEVVNSGADAVYVNMTSPTGIEKFTSNWDITDVQCKCDLLTLDNSLENEYASHLLSGKTLPINFSTWNHTNQSTGNDKNFSAHINRSLTRLKAVFITLGFLDSSKLKTCNNFYHPIGNSNNEGYVIHDEHSFQVQVGSKLYPEYPVSSVTEALYQLKKTVGAPFQMYARWYRTHRYIIGLDMEKISGAGFTGLSTKNGDLMTLNFRECSDAAGISTPNRVYAALHYDCVLNIKSEGVELLD